MSSEREPRLNPPVATAAVVLGVLGLLSSSLSGSPANAQEALALRVNDVGARPGGVVAVVLRTYAPRPIRQGQLCLISNRRGGRGVQPIFEALEEAVVFSEAGDAITTSSFETGAASQTVMVEFESLSAGVNRSDGPLAVIYLRLGDTVTAGELVDLQVDPAQTSLVDEAGQPIVFEPRAGELEILAVGAPLELEAAAEVVFPGRTAHLAVETSEVLPLSSGTVGFLYDPAIADGLPAISVDPRFGTVDFAVEHPQPGLALIAFSSPDGSFNRLPGGLLEVALPTVPGLPLGTTSVIALDGDLTTLYDVDLESIPLSLGNGSIEFGLGDPIFQDGFESGSATAWTRTVP